MSTGKLSVYEAAASSAKLKIFVKRIRWVLYLWILFVLMVL